MAKFIDVLRFSGILVCFFVGLKCSAQTAFLPNYRFRKEITVNTAKVEPGTLGKHTNFMLLVQVEDPAFIYDENAFENKLTSSQGLDISFADKATSKVPLKFQLESYDPVNGRIVCWVMIPVLWSRGSEGSNTLFIYYGSTILHDPQHPDVKSMWQVEHHTIQHFNENAVGKIHTAKLFNGISDQLELEAHNDQTFTFSAWIKLNNLGKEQMIATNDSLGIGGYQIKINSDNKLVLAVQNAFMPRPYISTSTLDVNVWYHVCISLNNTVVSFFINGKTEFSFGGGNYIAGSPGKIKIGVSKQGDRFFDGTIDELSIRKSAQIKGWMIATYENQLDPSAFFTFGSNETNPAMGELTYAFTGSRTSTWASAGNWAQLKIPGIENNIKILAGVVAEIKANVQVNKLLIEQGAQLILHADLQLSGSLKLEPGAALTSTATAKLQLHGNVLNHGNIALTGAASKLIFSGNKTLTRYEGNGSALTSLLEINQQAPGAIVEMNTLFKVKKTVQVINGILAANGHLLLLADALNTAAVYPLGPSAYISGNVQVQNFVSTYEAPATGRGWRLLSAPVIYEQFSVNNPSPFMDVKKSIFVTGNGGAGNGFDESPRNGVTIYTHDQSLAGTLAQKYVPISSVNMPLQTGKGFFVYSRGSRLIPDAYQHQIQGSPFLNATSYVITYTGPLFKGDLYVDVFNADRGEEGDGFNLLGNPYAAPIRWGSLHKVNVGPYIWLFDPLNNTYRVSMDPNEIIPAGAGFFIKVESNFKTGRVGFTEASKIL